jgi:hypothetical protein
MQLDEPTATDVLARLRRVEGQVGGRALDQAGFKILACGLRRCRRTSRPPSTPATARPSWKARRPGGAELTSHQGQERVKAAGTTARQVMTTPVVTAHPEEPVAEAARRMHARNVHQLAVVDRVGVLAGIISHADVLKVFLRDDREIRLELLDDIVAKLLRLQATSWLWRPTAA